MKKKHKQSKSKALLNKAMPYFYKYKNAKTRESYIKSFKMFLRYCTLNRKIISIDELKGNVELIQDYSPGTMATKCVCSAAEKED